MTATFIDGPLEGQTVEVARPVGGIEAYVQGADGLLLKTARYKRVSASGDNQAVFTFVGYRPEPEKGRA